MINNRTAKAIGLTIPQLFVLRADQIIDWRQPAGAEAQTFHV